MLPNSDLSDPAYIEKHGIEVIRVAFNHIHSAPKKDEEVREYSYLVRATATMPRADWVKANLFSVTVQCFHALGLLRFFALFLHARGLVSYYDFYSGLLEYIRNGRGPLTALWRTFQTKYESSLAGDWNYHNAAFGNVTWFFEEGAFLELATDAEGCARALLPYLKSMPIPAPLFEELRRYQRLMIRRPFDGERTERFTRDWHAFFDSVVKTGAGELKERDVEVLVVPAKRYDSLPLYAKETVWFGRRRGATVYHGAEVTVTDAAAAHGEGATT